MDQVALDPAVHHGVRGPITGGVPSRLAGADQLGHALPSMTQDVYMSRGQVQTELAAILPDTFSDGVEAGVPRHDAASVQQVTICSADRQSDGFL